MVKANSKIARQAIRAYIMDGFGGENYGIEAPETFEETARVILEIFRREYRHSWEILHRSERESFVEYCAGLPSILDTCYYYNRSAVDDLGEILQETPAERGKYSESEAERMLSLLIYRELLTVEN